MIKTDIYVNNKIKVFLPLFKYIHPNWITLIGLIINCLLLYVRKDYKFIFYLLNVLRILCDNLDGMIARKYNKTSYLGGLLDTIGDLTHIASISLIFFLDIFNFSYFTSVCLMIILSSINIYYMFSVNALSNHSNLYDRNDYKLLDYIPILLAQNTYLSAVFLNLFFIFYNYIF